MEKYEKSFNKISDIFEELQTQYQDMELLEKDETFKPILKEFNATVALLHGVCLRALGKQKATIKPRKNDDDENDVNDILENPKETHVALENGKSKTNNMLEIDKYVRNQNKREK